MQFFFYCLFANHHHYHLHRSLIFVCTLFLSVTMFVTYFRLFLHKAVEQSICFIPTISYLKSPQFPTPEHPSVPGCHVFGWLVPSWLRFLGGGFPFFLERVGIELNVIHISELTRFFLLLRCYDLIYVLVNCIIGVNVLMSCVITWLYG